MVNLGGRESRVEQFLGKRREALGNRRIGRLAQISGKYRAFDTRLAKVSKELFPGRFIRIIGCEAMLDYRAQRDQFGLFVSAQILRRELGVGDDDAVDTQRARLLHQREYLQSAQVPGLISSATGTFQDVTPGITEAGQIDDAGSQVTNAFSLQLNSQRYINTNECGDSTEPANCRAAQQFIPL